MIPRESLEDLRFLQDLTPAHLEQIGAIAELREVPAGAVVFREGTPCAFLYVVQNGLVQLELRVPGRGPVVLQTIGPGELLGWSPLLGQGPMTAGARAVVPCRLVAFHTPQLLALVEHDTRLGLELMRRAAAALAQRLEATRLHLLDVYRHELPAVSDQGGLP
jgi:CRP-like cAMP-binding protein